MVVAGISCAPAVAATVGILAVHAVLQSARLVVQTKRNTCSNPWLPRAMQSYNSKLHQQNTHISHSQLSTEVKCSSSLVLYARKTLFKSAVLTNEK